MNHMGLRNFIRGQFLDTIEYVDNSDKVIIHKFVRESGDNEIKNGSQVIVREGQQAVFLNKGQLADILTPGTWTLNTENLPILSSLSAIGYLFNSPIKADLYFIGTHQYTGNKWATKNPVILRDPDLGVVRVRCFGQYSFRIVDSSLFMQEVFGSKGLVLTWDIVSYLSSLIAESFAQTLSSLRLSVFDLSAEYKNIGNQMREMLNEWAVDIGVEFANIVIENISLPDEVEKYIDEQSAIGLAKTDMNSFMQYQTARAMRDAAKQDGGIAGAGLGVALGKQISESVTRTSGAGEMSLTEKMRELKMLLDEGLITEEEYSQKKKQILNL